MVRIKNRYLLVHILSPDLDPLRPPRDNHEVVPAVVEFHQPSPDTLDPRLFAQMIREQVSLMYGDYGLGLVTSSLKIIYLSTATSTVIVKVARDHYRLVWAALSFLTQVPDKGKGTRACVMRVVRVSGTIKKAEEEAIKRAREAILRAKGQVGGNDSSAVLGEGGDKDGGDAVMMGADGSDDGEEDLESEDD